MASVVLCNLVHADAGKPMKQEMTPALELAISAARRVCLAGTKGRCQHRFGEHIDVESDASNKNNKPVKQACRSKLRFSTPAGDCDVELPNDPTGYSRFQDWLPDAGYVQGIHTPLSFASLSFAELPLNTTGDYIDENGHISR